MITVDELVADVRPQNPSLRVAVSELTGCFCVQVVGAERSYAFLRYCFGGQGYLVTRCDTQRCDPESALWGDYSSPHPGK